MLGAVHRASVTGQRREPIASREAAGTAARATEKGTELVPVSEIAQRSFVVGVANDARNLTPNPFPRGKGDRISGSNLFTLREGNRIVGE